jgi:DNA-binding HxlR family transcriptional regulator
MKIKIKMKRRAAYIFDDGCLKFLNGSWFVLLIWVLQHLVGVTQELQERTHPCSHVVLEVLR